VDRRLVRRIRLGRFGVLECLRLLSWYESLDVRLSMAFLCPACSSGLNSTRPGWCAAFVPIPARRCADRVACGIFNQGQGASRRRGICWLGAPPRTAAVPNEAFLPMPPKLHRLPGLQNLVGKGPGLSDFVLQLVAQLSRLAPWLGEDLRFPCDCWRLPSGSPALPQDILMATTTAFLETGGAPDQTSTTGTAEVGVPTAAPLDSAGAGSALAMAQTAERVRAGPRTPESCNAGSSVLVGSARAQSCACNSIALLGTGK